MAVDSIKFDLIAAAVALKRFFVPEAYLHATMIADEAIALGILLPGSFAERYLPFVEGFIETALRVYLSHVLLSDELIY
jgi:hypothetical protein